MQTMTESSSPINSSSHSATVRQVSESASSTATRSSLTLHASCITHLDVYGCAQWLCTCSILPAAPSERALPCCTVCHVHHANTTYRGLLGYTSWKKKVG